MSSSSSSSDSVFIQIEPTNSLVSSAKQASYGQVVPLASYTDVNVTDYKDELTFESPQRISGGRYSILRFRNLSEARKSIFLILMSFLSVVSLVYGVTMMFFLDLLRGLPLILTFLVASGWVFKNMWFDPTKVLVNKWLFARNKKSDLFKPVEFLRNNLLILDNEDNIEHVFDPVEGYLPVYVDKRLPDEHEHKLENKYLDETFVTAMKCDTVEYELVPDNKMMCGYRYDETIVQSKTFDVNIKHAQMVVRSMPQDNSMESLLQMMRKTSAYSGLPVSVEVRQNSAKMGLDLFNALKRKITEYDLRVVRTGPSYCFSLPDFPKRGAPATSVSTLMGTLQEAAAL